MPPPGDPRCRCWERVWWCWRRQASPSPAGRLSDSWCRWWAAYGPAHINQVDVHILYTLFSHMHTKYYWAVGYIHEAVVSSVKPAVIGGQGSRILGQWEHNLWIIVWKISKAGIRNEKNHLNSVCETHLAGAQCRPPPRSWAGTYKRLQISVLESTQVIWWFHVGSEDLTEIGITF